MIALVLPTVPSSAAMKLMRVLLPDVSPLFSKIAPIKTEPVLLPSVCSLASGKLVPIPTLELAKIARYELPVALINPPVNTLPPLTLPLTDTIVPVWLAAFTMVVASTLLAFKLPLKLALVVAIVPTIVPMILSPVMLPVADI